MTQKPVGFWATESDLENLQKIGESTGIRSRTDIIRYALRQAVVREAMK